MPYKELYNKEGNKLHPICGTIGQNHTGYLQATPGIHLDKSGDNSNQRYKSPESEGKRSRFIYIGRAIYTIKNPLEEIKRYHANYEIINEII